ncbi:hypothetical protein [Fusobacterium sp. PH5-44]|uniref:hypothetical protein n=1 Tax=unclassified Fusobacterium TaxID=2648384 RepID=UPI003D22268D
MNKLLFSLVISITIISGCSSLTSSGSNTSSGTTTSPGSAISKIFSKIPSDLQEEVNNRVDTNSELFGFGTANSAKIGSAAGQMKSLDNAKSDLNSKIKKEAQKYLNAHYNSLEPYTKTLVKPALSDLVNHTTELSAYNITQKGAWEGENKVHSLVTVKTSDIETHAKNVFSTFLDNMSDKISSAKSSI